MNDPFFVAGNNETLPFNLPEEKTSERSRKLPIQDTRIIEVNKVLGILIVHFTFQQLTLLDSCDWFRHVGKRVTSRS